MEDLPFCPPKIGFITWENLELSMQPVNLIWLIPDARGVIKAIRSN